MNDSHLDLPEPFEPPECCGDFMVEHNGKHVCPNCGHEIMWDYVLPEDDVPEEPPQPQVEHCPHGKVAGKCDACDHLADLAFDAAREARYFR